MEAVREKWTDERLDDMNGRMAEGFDRLDKDIREVRSEIAGVRSEVAGVRTEVAGVRTEVAGVRKEVAGVKSEVTELRSEIAQVRIDLLEEMNRRFEATHRLIIQVGGGLFGTMALGFLSLVLTQH
jgi:archaellum component FlaC